MYLFILIIICVIVIAILIANSDKPFLSGYRGGGGGDEDLIRGDVAYISPESQDVTLYNKPGTMYNVGSIAKPFTAYLLAILQEKGFLKFSDSANKYLRSWKLPSDDITIEMLMHHSSGLSQDHIYGFPLTVKLPSLVEILNGSDLLSEAPKQQFPEVFAERPPPDYKVVLDSKPGLEWKYNSNNYVVLQLLIEDLTESRYADLVDQYIFTPLGMKSSTFDFKKAKSRLAVPHWKDGKPMPYYHFACQATAGLYSDIDDMILWVRELMKPTLISGDSWKQLRESPINKDYGLGFMIENEGTAVAHRGTNWGWKSYFYASPDEGYVYLSNWQADEIPKIPKMPEMLQMSI